MNQLSTAQQKRILRLMCNGDLIWEVAGKSYRSIYNERLGRQQRVPASTVEEMEQRGWIRRLDNPNSSRLDGWEMMREVGRALGEDVELGWDTKVACEHRYRTLLRQKAALIVVDDVWSAEHLKPLSVDDAPRS